jgi:riboflavin biosynthesis pyrimidine reductase
LTSEGNLPLELKLFNADLPGKTVIAATQKIKHQFPPHIEILQVTDLFDLLTKLGQRNITSLLVEGGVKVREEFFQAKLVNRIQVYLAPVVIASLSKKATLLPMDAVALGPDLSISVDCEYYPTSRDLFAGSTGPRT